MVPLAKAVGAATSPARRDRAAYLTSPEGKTLYRLRASSIEPFFATLKAFFQLDPLPVRGETAVSAVILVALYVWNLIVLFNYLNDRPLGQLKPLLELL